MYYIDDFRRYVSNNYKDLAYREKGVNAFPDIETGFTLVKIVYNDAYHSLDMRFAGMANYEAIFGKYVYPVLMKYRGFGLYKMGSSRVIRVKVPCINEDLGFIEEDAKEQLDMVRTLLEILRKMNVTQMFAEQRIARNSIMTDESAVFAEVIDFNKDFREMLTERRKEIQMVGADPVGKEGILVRLDNMSWDLRAFLQTHTDFFSSHFDAQCVKEASDFNEMTEKLRKELE